MDPAPPPLPANRWSRPLAPLSVAVYVACAAIIGQAWIDHGNGRWEWSPLTIAGLLGMCAVPVLYLVRASCPDPGADEGLRRRLRLLALLQLPAALLACWAFGGGPMPVLLVIVAGQIGAIYPPRQAVALMLGANVLLLLMLWRRWGFVDAATSLLSYGSFQAFAGLVSAYANSAEEARDAAVRINGELLATRRLLLESARGEERLRLSRELHDVVGHKLTALKLQLRLLARQDGGEMAAACERLADELLADVRGVVGAMRRYEGIELQQALAALVPALPQPRVTLELAPDARAADLAQAQALLRCAQEGLTNALRHSGAERVLIRLQAADGGLLLMVEDDGRARQLPQPGNGLRGMCERLEGLGGRLDLVLREGGGLSLHAWLPQDAA